LTKCYIPLKNVEVFFGTIVTFFPSFLKKQISKKPWAHPMEKAEFKLRIDKKLFIENKEKKAFTHNNDMKPFTARKPANALMLYIE